MTPPPALLAQGENLDLAITKEEVVVLVGEGVCAVKTLTRNHLYCEPPPQQPGPGPNGKKREGSDSLPDFTVSSACCGPNPGALVRAPTKGVAQTGRSCCSRWPGAFLYQHGISSRKGPLKTRGRLEYRPHVDPWSCTTME